MIDYQSALALEIAPVEQSYSEKDTILYSLGLGLGGNPTNEEELTFVYEDGLRAMPTMPVAMAFTSFRDIPLAVDYRKLVHGEQGLIVHQPLPVSGTVVGQTFVRDVIDRGADKGALIYLEREIRNKEDDTHLASATMTAFCRGDGGVAGAPESTTPAVHPIPERPADLEISTTTLSQAALIYRLSGDLNPLHADPSLAGKVGFDAPILHGLATFGIMGLVIIENILNWRPEFLQTLDMRFSAPVYPGETIVTELWHDGNEVSFRAKAKERDTLILNNGCALVTG
tara:strand:+ start:231 stop:1085 length:855 start_codon:yes stop_codon:yes gene_type:complete